MKSGSKPIGNRPPHAKLLRLPQVLELIPVSRSTWYKGVSLGRFPRPVKLSERIAAWRYSDIQDLIEKQSV